MIDEARRPWYKYVTIEPVMFFYMMAYMITNVIEQTFYVFRACTVDHGYSEEICYNINKYEDINKEVQVTVSTFHQWNGIAGHVVPLLLAFFLGSYSDKRGRKVVLLAGLLGKLYFSIMITVNTVKPWPLSYVIYTAAFPSALTGADLAIFAGCFAYISDVSSINNRTLRVGILDVVYLSTMPTGVAIGNLIYNRVVNKSFTAMFAINSCLMLVATLYCTVFLKWQTRPEQRSLKDDDVTNPVKDFFDLNNIRQTLITLTKKRSNNRRLFLWFLLISMAFYTFQRDERPVMYLYMIKVFKWDATDFSNFRTYLSTAYVVVMLLGIPLMTKILNWRDTVIVMLGASAHMCGHLTYAHAQTDNTLYIGATAAALGPCVAPLIRSMTSKILAPSERGVAFAFLSVMENAVAMFASVLYSQLYKATLDTSYINAIFYLTMGTQAVVFVLSLTMEILLKGRRLEAQIHEDVNSM
ncbi:lysosomal proton-coupled steroid conjugate and bile acid symporter SLC46A3 isoform X2 [Danaus plexippus]|uniref:lysosomal proton-coupled steroid conjugate and bile acid symporter SLC46A3 isoform X2 n=1 Tax=Danaus plexippus TaxID=13037 RepID=UPI0013C50CDD|nr:lysosomal proton-coupled steroid conjugate and bile acid symporter SLC46A3 isoform X2 [Danaus plexippus]